VPRFGVLRGNVHGSSMARRKACGGLPISGNWTVFASCNGRGAMSGWLKGQSRTMKKAPIGKVHALFY